MSFLHDKVWYGTHFLKWILLPLSWIYRGVHFLRRWYLQIFCQQFSSVPIIVVGNLTLGGVGKTPLVIALVKKMQQKGLNVGIVSRGYGATIRNFPYEVQVDDLASRVGDEPLMLVQKTKCPVIIAPKRVDAVAYLIKHHQVQVIISDDGLQHYKMGRAIEIAVIDGMRGLGNKLCLPAGPLREPVRRLQEVDFVVVNGTSWEGAYSMTLVPGCITNLSTQKQHSPDYFSENITALAGIGNPQRFYSTLRQLGIEFTEYSFPDHHQFKASDLHGLGSSIIMTEKDAVKCRSFNSDKLYFLPVEAKLSDAFWSALWSHQQLQGYCKNEVN